MKKEQMELQNMWEGDFRKKKKIKAQSHPENTQWENSKNGEDTGFVPGTEPIYLNLKS